MGGHLYLFGIRAPVVTGGSGAGVLLIRWSVNLVVTVLHCNWCYSALRDLQPEGRTRAERFSSGWDKKRTAGHVTRGRSRTPSESAIKEPGEYCSSECIQEDRWRQEGKKKKMKWLVKAIYETSHFTTGNGAQGDMSGQISRKMIEQSIISTLRAVVCTLLQHNVDPVWPPAITTLLHVFSSPGLALFSAACTARNTPGPTDVSGSRYDYLCQQQLHNADGHSKFDENSSRKVKHSRETLLPADFISI